MATAEDYAQWIVNNADKKGTPDFETVAAAYKAAREAQSSEKPAVVEAGNSINGLWRQAGLTARAGIEGAAGFVSPFSEPIRMVTDKVFNGGKPSKSPHTLANDLADTIGLPKPENATERFGGTVAQMMAGAGAPASLAMKVAPKMSGMPQKVAEFFAQSPTQQVITAGTAGAAGSAVKEAGGSPIEQLGASLLGALAGAGAGRGAQGVADKARVVWNQFMSPQKVDVKIGEVLAKSGIDYSQVPEKIRQSLRTELRDAMLTDKQVNPEALSRLLAFREAGVKPTLGMITQNPVQITREQNLAKIGANSGDGTLHGLALLQNQNNRQLIGNLNTLGANSGSVDRAGDAVVSSVLRNQSQLRGAEQSAWDAAKSSPAYRQPVSASVLSDINRALGDEGLMPFMSPSISKYMEAFQNGHPFTPQDYKNLQSMLSREIAKGGNEGYAAGVASRILAGAELKPAGVFNPSGVPVTSATANAMRHGDEAATSAVDAVNQARRATRQAYAYEDSSPLVRSVLSGGASSDPRRIAERFVIGGTANEAEDLIRNVGPQGAVEIKNALLSHLKDKALSGATDEVGKFSQAAFNRALNAIGERKLSILFTPDEIHALRTNGRVAALMQSQPIGSAVNNSNSGALLLGRGIDLLDKLPVFGPMVAPALKNIDVSLQTRAAQKLLPGLLDETKTPGYAPFIGAGTGIGGLLAAP